MRRTRELTTTKVKRRKRIVTYITVEREVVRAGPVYSAFAEILRMQRGELGMTQEDMAKAMGMSRPSIANIEAGRQRVMLGDIFDFARVLNIDAKKLFAMVAAEINT